MYNSGVATGGSRGAECHPWQRKICQKSGKKSRKIGKKEGKSGRKSKNRQGSFTLPLLTDSAGYATDVQPASHLWLSHPPPCPPWQANGRILSRGLSCHSLENAFVKCHKKVSNFNYFTLNLTNDTIAVTTLSHSKNECDVTAYIMLGTVEMHVLFLVGRKYAYEY